MVHDFVKFPELTNGQMNDFYHDSPHRQISEDFTASVVKVIDGDTINVQWSERDFVFPVRFSDIAAPESKEPGGLESQQWLESILLGKEVNIIINPKRRVGKWGRLVGQVHFEGVNVGSQSVQEGHSVPWENRKDGNIPDFDKEIRKWEV